MSPSNKAITQALMKLMLEVGRGPVTVDFEGQQIEVNKKYVAALYNRENARLSRGAKGSKKSAPVSAEERAETIDLLRERVVTALSRMDSSVKVSSELRRSITDGVTEHLKTRHEAPSRATFVPRLLFYLDQPFVDFLSGVKLDLFAHYFEGRGSAGLRRELTEVEEGLMSFLRETQVGASTVLNALVTLYITTQGLRESIGGQVMIRVDDRLKRFLQSPMDSRLHNRSFAQSYVSTRDTKVVRVGGEEVERPTLAKYRKDHPTNSVMDYIKHSNPDHSYLSRGYIRGADVMSLVSAHLISHKTVGSELGDDLSMRTENGHYTNPKVYTLIALQAIVSATNGGSDKSAAPTAARVRSPSRSPDRTRAASRSPDKVKSPAVRSPSRSTSRGRP